MGSRWVSRPVIGIGFLTAALTLAFPAQARPSVTPSAGVAAGHPAQFPVDLVFSCKSPICPGKIPQMGKPEFFLDIPPGACGGPIINLAAMLNIRHTWRSDITVNIGREGDTAPPWRRLFSALDGRYDNIGMRSGRENLILDDRVTRYVDEGDCQNGGDDACFGRFATRRHELFHYTGMLAEGRWYLQVEDGAQLDEGTLNTWSLIVTCLPPTPTPTPTSTALSSPTRTATPTASPTDRLRSTATTTPRRSVTPTTPRPTATPSPRPSRTPKPGKIYLPLLRDDFCPPKYIYADIVLVLDMSTSMLEITSSGQPKYAVAIEGARRLIRGLRLEPGMDQVSIVTFNTQADLVLPLTSDRALAESKLGAINAVVRESRLELGVYRAMGELLGPRRHGITQNIVVLSDGKANPVPGQAAIDAASQAKEALIIVTVVGLGPDLDLDTLRAMSTDGARFRVAGRPEDLIGIYQSLWVTLLCSREVYWPPP